MNAKTIVSVVIVLAIGVIMVGSLLVPSLNNYSDAEKTIDNTGTNYSLYEVGDTHTITFTTDNVTTDGVSQPLPDTSKYGSATIVYGVNGIFRLHNDGHIRYWGVYTSGDVDRDLGLAKDVTIVIDATGKSTASNVDASINTRDFNNTVMFPNPTGYYTLSYNPYILEDSVIYGCGNTLVGSTTYTLSWTGTEDDITVSWDYPPAQEISGIVVNTTNPSTNLLKVDSVVISNTTAGADFTYTYFFAPKEITYENPEYIGGNNASLLLVIPVLIITSFIVIGVRMFMGSRD